MGVADPLAFAIIAHLDADIGQLVVVVEVPTLMALVELDEELAVVPGKGRDIRIAFSIALKCCVARIFF